MTRQTKRSVDIAVDELKREGYMTLMIMLNQRADEHNRLGGAVEVLCSETNDPKLLAAMLRTTLEQLTQPVEVDRLN